ncbi:MAG: DUF1573 domain-containing protein [Muribaculaceae bacterium]|nr:DUF1573 domain-containing protein [Muribaculaceae bacterium]
MRKSIVAFLVFVFSFPFLLPADVKWLSTEYNYGAFKEAEGPRKGSVRFVNTGSKPTFIRNVRPSCGCTGAEYTEDMIQPGDTATVSFIYDPSGRPGPFDKTVKVYLGADNELQVVRITGTVIGAPETLEKSYPYEGGALRYETLSQTMGEVKKGSARHVFINVYNQGTDTVRPEWTSRSSALQVDMTPHSLAPGEIGTFGFYLNSTKEPEAGPVEYLVKVSPGGDSKGRDVREIRITAAIVPDSRSMSAEEIENGPRAYLVPEFIDFGEDVSEGELPFEFDVLNDGKSELEVRRVYSHNENVRITSFPKKVGGEGKDKVKGSLSLTSVPSGPFRIAVEVITNDPLHPLRTANLVGIKK